MSVEEEIARWRLLKQLLEHLAYYDYASLGLPAMGLLTRQAEQERAKIEDEWSRRLAETASK